MATLSENLSYIYDIKQDIKEVIGTNSDLFSEYPQLIQEAIDEVPAGYTYVSGETYLNLAFNWDDENGAWKSEDDVTSYATAVGFLNQANPDDPSYILSNGLTEVGSVAYGNYNAYVYVNVPPTIPAGYTYVSGDYEFPPEEFQYDSFRNGYMAVVDSTDYATVSCYLGMASSVTPQDEFTTNGIYHIDSVAYGNYDAYISVNVPTGIPTGYTYVDSELWTQNIDNYEFWVDGSGAYYKAHLNREGVSGQYISIDEPGDFGETNAYVITGNGSYVISPIADIGYFREKVTVNVPPTIPAGYTYVSGDTSIDSSSFEYNGIGYLATIDSTEYATVSCYLGCADPEGWIPEISDNGIWHVDSVAYGNYDAYVYVNVPSSGIIPSGTYYVNDNGTYDISEYEYVDVSVSGTPVTTYTWSGLTRGGNPDVNQSGEQSDNENNALMLYVAEGSGWTKKYSQIIPTRQFSYQLPTSITARTWDDYNPSTYIMTDYSGCTYSCDPSNYDNLTNVMNTSGGSSGQDCSYEVSGLDVYGLSDYSMTTAGFFGSSVHNLSKLTDLKCIQWNTDDPSNPYEENIKSTMLCAALTDGNHTAYIPETSYFGGMTDVRNLAGRTWKMIFTQYQGRLSLKDIVGPVSGSEVYMNEIDDVWANWMGGWNSSTSSTYNTTTGNIEIQYTANYVIGSSSTPSTAELHQLEYRLTSGGTARRIDTEIVGSLDTADHSNLSGTVTLNAIPRTNENYHYVNLFNIDNSDLQNEGYTQYDLTLTLKIPHDMWLYGSTNHNQMTLDWTLTPSSVLPSEDVTNFKMNIGTNAWASDTSGSQTQDGWEVSSTKSNKSATDLNNYRIWSIKVDSSINGTTQWLPDIQSPISATTTHTEQTVTLKVDDGDVQIFNVDSTVVTGTGNGTFKVKVYDDFFDSTSQNYHKAVLSLDLDGYTINNWSGGFG